MSDSGHAVCIDARTHESTLAGSCTESIGMQYFGEDFTLAEYYCSQADASIQGVHAKNCASWLVDLHMHVSRELCIYRSFFVLS